MEDGYPVLAVDDSGPGIPAHERQRVFERFYRMGGSGGSSGSGLGMSIVAHIVTVHSARIELVDSDLGGLGVRIHFPAASS